MTVPESRQGFVEVEVTIADYCLAEFNARPKGKRSMDATARANGARTLKAFGMTEYQFADKSILTSHGNPRVYTVVLPR